MNDVEEALSHYRISYTKYDFIRWNENKTYHVIDVNKEYLLRIHEPNEGFDESFYVRKEAKKEKIEKELNALNYLSLHGLEVQTPIITNEGTFVGKLENGYYYSLVKWIPGIDLKDEYHNHLKELGELMGYIHKAGNGFNSYYLSYDEAYIDRLITLLSSLNISIEQQYVLKNTLIEIKKVMNHLEKESVLKGLIHSDLSFSNIILSDNRLIPIDFSLFGYGYYAHEIGMLFCNINSIEERRIVLDSYEKMMNIRICIHDIDAFFCLSIILYILLHINTLYKEETFTRRFNKWNENYFKKLIVKINFSC